ncbi:MAG: amidohydrolase family protein, partial [Sphingopyxis sp.]
MTSVRSRPPALVAALQSLGLAASLMAAAPSHAAEQVLYTNVSVIDGTGGPARAGQDILIDGERIVAVGAHDTLASRAGTARRVDLTGRFVIP